MEGVVERRARNIRVVLAYDGAGYLGWQAQPHGPSIQTTLQQALERITGERSRVKGAGRTDAGVHALGQVANFHTFSRIDAQAFAHALNSVLPPSIAVLRSDEVDGSFDAQFSAIGKHYRYRVFNSRIRSPIEHGRSWFINRRLNVESMRDASQIILGLHDFSSFRAHGCVANSPVRDLRRCNIVLEGDIIRFDLEADGFLRHMVRNIVGSLVEVGNGRFSAADISRILTARDRTAAGVAAPAHGLYMVQVDYPAPEARSGETPDALDSAADSA